MKRTLSFLLTIMALSIIFTSLPSCKQLAKSGAKILLSDKKDRSRAGINRKNNTDKKSSGTGLVGAWGVEYETEDGGSFYIGLDFDDDETFFYIIEITDSSDNVLLTCSFLGNYSKDGNRISYTPDTSSFSYDLNSAIDDPTELLDYVTQMKSAMFSMPDADDEIIKVNADKLILKDLSDGESIEYFRE